jgi:two-component system, NtrC family, response regulator AtoC
MSDEPKIKLLVVDDEQSIRKLCMTIGVSLGFVCSEAESAETAVTRLETEPPDLVLTDLKLPNHSGVELLKQIRGVLPRTEIAIMTGHGSIESAVDAMKLGAYDYIEKPFRVEKLRLLLQRMAEKVRLVNENAFLRERVNADENLDGIIGNSSGIQDVLRMISRLKDTRTPVQGISRTCGPFSWSPCTNALCGGGLRVARANIDGKRIVWLRKGRVHGSHKN